MDKIQYKIGGMSCSFCTETIKRAVGKIEGVSKVHVSLAHEETLIEYNSSRVSLQELKDAISDVGYTLRDPDKIRTFEEEEEEIRREGIRLLLAGSLTGLAFILMFLMWIGKMFPYSLLIVPLLAFLTVFIIGWPILKMAWGSLKRGILNQHVLLEFAAFAGLIGGIIGLFYPQFPAMDFFGVAIFVTTYHILSQYTSLYVRTRSSQAVRKLLDLQPATALVIRNGKEIEVPINEVKSGNLIRVKPGSEIPVDGEVVEGASAVNESLVTGEPLPKDKVEGDKVIGGSLNLTGYFIVRATSVGKESFLQKIANHIQEARALKPSIIQVVDQILIYFVPGVLTFSAAALLIWTVGAWIIIGEPNMIRAVFAALAVLVMGYPCALGMATPLAMIRGGREAALKGILMRTGEAFQVFKDVKKVVLDKTGTITIGKPKVHDIFPVEEATPEEILMIAASAEKHSEHPLAQAIVEKAKENEVILEEIENFKVVAGSGVSAEVDSKKVLIGNLNFLKGEGVKITDEVKRKITLLQEEAKTVVGLSIDGILAGLLTITDSLKEDASNAIARMKSEGLTPIMLTGDNEKTAGAVATLCGIDEVYSQVLPQDKAAKIRELQKNGLRVAMVGDGINDAPALMQADVGVAIGAGTDIAIESSDVILVGERLGGFVDAYLIAKRSFRKTVQNLALAFSFNGIGVPLAVTGLVHPVWAMIAMAASVSAVLLNSFGGSLLPKRGKISKEHQEIWTMNIPSLHCEGCLTTIKDALDQLPDVVKVEGSLKDKWLTVTIQKGSLTKDDIVEKIIKLGHVVDA